VVKPPKQIITIIIITGIIIIDFVLFLSYD